MAESENEFVESMRRGLAVVTQFMDRSDRPLVKNSSEMAALLHEAIIDPDGPPGQREQYLQRVLDLTLVAGAMAKLYADKMNMPLDQCLQLMALSVEASREEL
jgi:hypothetical protein